MAEVFQSPARRGFHRLYRSYLGLILISLLLVYTHLGILVIKQIIGPSSFAAVMLYTGPNKNTNPKLVPSTPSMAPEYAYYDIHPCIDTVELQCTRIVYEALVVSSLPHALQLCLGIKDCGGVLFYKESNSALLCADISEDAVHSSTTAILKEEGRHHQVYWSPWLSDSIREQYRLSTKRCTVSASRSQQQRGKGCPHKDQEFTTLTLVPNFTESVQTVLYTPAFNSMWDQPPAKNFRAYNPGIVEYRENTWYTFVRISNWTHCPWLPRPGGLVVNKKASVYSITAMCQLDTTTWNILESTCKYIPVVAEESIAVQYPRESSTTVLTANSFSLPHPVGRGIEDIRPFMHHGALRATGNVKNMHDDRKTSTTMVVDLEVDAEQGLMMKREIYGILCDSEATSWIQKNWMPLSSTTRHKDGMFYITRLSPLTVVQLQEVEDGGGVYCRLAYREPLPLRNYDATTHGYSLRGGSAFIYLNDGYYLGMAHTRAPGGMYIHHLLVLEIKSATDFEIAWLSESFRLPKAKTIRPDQKIQFSMTIARMNNDLLITYGDADCESIIGISRDFFSNLKTYMQHGLPLTAAHSDGGGLIEQEGCRLPWLDPDEGTLSKAVVVNSPSV